MLDFSAVSQNLCSICVEMKVIPYLDVGVVAGLGLVEFISRCLKMNLAKRKDDFGTRLISIVLDFLNCQASSLRKGTLDLL